MTGTDLAGHYRSIFSLGTFIRQTSCFVVLVSPPSGSALEPSPAVPFTVQFHRGLPRDSVRVDVTLTEPVGQ